LTNGVFQLVVVGLASYTIYFPVDDFQFVQKEKIGDFDVSIFMVGCELFGGEFSFCCRWRGYRLKCVHIIWCKKIDTLLRSDYL
jgi:hypothetical protein